MKRSRYRCGLGGVILGLAAAPALAQPGPDGIDWVTIGSPNNPAYHGPDPFGLVSGRGSVAYEYRLSRTEVTSAQWLEFFNAALARPDPIAHVQTPIPWGGQVDPTYQGPGTRYRLSSTPNAGMLPAYGVTWRTAAIYANWLHNGKSLDSSAFLSGAYDVSTFGYDSLGRFTDQATRSPGARYWIPSLDEWIKAAHYDPANPNRDGWWLAPNRSDGPMTYGPPVSFGGDGTGMANAGFMLPNFAHYNIPLASYAVTSPWGLLDVGGCAGEWTEEIREGTAGRFRSFDGSPVASSPSGAVGADLLYAYGSTLPDTRGSLTGVRIASFSVPSPCLAMGFVAWCFRAMLVRPHRRRFHETVILCSSCVGGGVWRSLGCPRRTGRRSRSSGARPEARSKRSTAARSSVGQPYRSKVCIPGSN